MKIAMLTSWDEACGIAEYSKALVKALQPQADITVVPIQHGRRQRAYFQALAQACNTCDLVHIQHEYIFFGGRDPWNYYWPVVTRGIHKPYMVTAHTWLRNFTGGPFWKRSMREVRDYLYRKSGWSGYLEAGQFQSAQRVIVHTQGYARELEQKGIPREKIVVLPQGVPQAFITGDAALARKRWNLQGKVVVVFGFLIPSKGHLVALEAWKKTTQPATLVIIGKPFSKSDEVYAKRVSQAVQGQAASVRMTGYLSESELADLLAATDLCLLPYSGGTSSYSLSVLLAQGKAVLASDLDCFKEIRAQQPCLELFPSNQADALASQLNLLLSNEQRLQRLRQAAGEWTRQHTWDRIASQLSAVYTQILSNPSGRG